MFVLEDCLFWHKYKNLLTFVPSNLRLLLTAGSEIKKTLKVNWVNNNFRKNCGSTIDNRNPTYNGNATVGSSVNVEMNKISVFKNSILITNEPIKYTGISYKTTILNDCN